MAKIQVSTPSVIDAEKRIVELRGIKALVADGTLKIKGDFTVGHGFLVKVKAEGGEWIRDVLFIVNRENTAICRNWPAVPTPKHKEPVEVELAANSGESATFAVVR